MGVDEEAAKKKKEAEAIKRAELREFLASQLEHKQEVAKREKDEQLIWARQFDEEKERAEAEEAKKLDLRKQRALDDKLTREEQIANRAKRQALEAKARNKYERDLLKRLVEEGKKDEAKALEKKQKEKKKYKQIFLDNQKELEHKKIRQLQEQEEDLVRMKEYARLMDEQEKKRTAEWDAFVERQAKLMEQKVKYEQVDLSGRVLMSDEKFAEKERERLAAEAAAQDARARKKKAEAEACIAVVEQQLQAKAEARRREAAEGERDAAKARRLHEEHELQETKREEEKRLRNLKYKKELEEQITGRRVATTLMSDTERALNKKTVTKAYDTLRSTGLID